MLWLWINIHKNSLDHRWKLPGNHPVFTMVLVICHYIERIWRNLITPIFIRYTIIKKYHPGGPVNIHIQSLIKNNQEEWGNCHLKKVRVN